jgi:hypothetical protein
MKVGDKVKFKRGFGPRTLGKLDETAIPLILDMTDADFIVGKDDVGTIVTLKRVPHPRNRHFIEDLFEVEFSFARKGWLYNWMVDIVDEPSAAPNAG